MNTLEKVHSSSISHSAPSTKVPELTLSSRFGGIARKSRRAAPQSALSLIRDNRGANLVEYIIVVGLIALIAIVGFKAFGQKVSDRIQKQSESVGNINAEAK